MILLSHIDWGHHVTDSACWEDYPMTTLWPSWVALHSVRPDGFFFVGWGWEMEEVDFRFTFTAST